MSCSEMDVDALSSEWMRGLRGYDRRIVNSWISEEEVSKAAFNKIALTAPVYQGPMSRGVEFQTKTEAGSFIRGVVFGGGVRLTGPNSFSSQERVAMISAGSGSQVVLLRVQSQKGRAIGGNESEVIGLRGSKYTLSSLPQSESVSWSDLKGTHRSKTVTVIDLIED